MKLRYQYSMILTIFFSIQNSSINGMNNEELSKSQLYTIMERVKAPAMHIKLDDCSKITELQFHNHNNQLTVTAFYIKKIQDESIEHQQGMYSTWDCSSLKLLHSEEALIISRKQLQPSSDDVDDQIQKPTESKLPIANPAHKNQWISKRDKDDQWAVYMENPFVRICFLSNNGKRNPEMAVYSPNGNHIATAYGTTITLWNLLCKNCLMRTLEKPLKWQKQVLLQVLNQKFVKPQDKKWLSDQFKINFLTKRDANRRGQKHQLIDNSTRFVRHSKKAICEYVDQSSDVVSAE